MNRTHLSASLCIALVCAGHAACAAAPSGTVAVPQTATATATPVPPTKNPIPPPPKASPDVEKIITAMNNASTWGHPDLFGEFAGARLYSEGRYEAAIKYFEYGARYADKLSQLSIGLMYDNGRGIAKDPARACAWLALAAERKYPSFIATRDRVCEALTPSQHDEAVAVLDKLLPEYGDAVAKKRMAHALEMAKTEGTGSRLGFDSGITTTGVKQNCGGPTVGDAPIAGCGNTNFWSPWRWDPGKYFAARDAHWRGKVTVGSMEDVHKAASGTGVQTPADEAQPVSASSAGH